MSATLESQANSPFLSSYQGLSGNTLIGLANLQSSYNPTPPEANFNRASQYVNAAASATDPNLQAQLLQDAINELTPGGGASQSAGSTGAAGAAGGTAGGGITAQQLAQGMEQLYNSLTGGNLQLGAAGGDTATTAPASDDTSAGADSTPLSVSGNSVNTGEYTIAGSKNDDGSLTITNNATGQQTEVWGDPHIKVNGKDTADFQKGPLNIQLQDGTTIHIDPTQLQNGVAHIGQVSITKGDQSVEMGGVGQNGFQGGVNTSAVQDGNAGYQNALNNSPSATDITLGSDGNLYYNNDNGSMGSEITAQANGGETDLDNAGGGLVGQGGASTASGNGASVQALMAQLEGILSQNSDSFSAIMMQNALSQMQNSSGYQTA